MLALHPTIRSGVLARMSKGEFLHAMRWLWHGPTSLPPVSSFPSSPRSLSLALPPSLPLSPCPPLSLPSFSTPYAC